jgi:hypothetical protein
MKRSVPKGDGPRDARFNQLLVTRFVTDVSKATGHSNSRNSHVAQVASFFSAIRTASPDLTTARVFIEAAQRQLFRSPNGYQAAHYVPGQLKIGSQLPWMLIPNSSARLRLEYLFADVEHLPAAFNIADSAAEEKGLCETFRAAGEAVLRDPFPSPKKGMVNRPLVRRIYDDLWVPGAAVAYSEAALQKRLVSEVPALEYDEEGNISNLEERGEADPSRDEEMRILQLYREALRTPPPDLKDEKMAEIERVFQA